MHSPSASFDFSPALGLPRASFASGVPDTSMVRIGAEKSPDTLSSSHRRVSHPLITHSASLTLRTQFLFLSLRRIPPTSASRVLSSLNPTSSFAFYIAKCASLGPADGARESLRRYRSSRYASSLTPITHSVSASPVLSLLPSRGGIHSRLYPRERESESQQDRSIVLEFLQRNNNTAETRGCPDIFYRKSINFPRSGNQLAEWFSCTAFFHLYSRYDKFLAATVSIVSSESSTVSDRTIRGNNYDGYKLLPIGPAAGVISVRGAAAEIISLIAAAAVPAATLPSHHYRTI